jgi:hypothetical protein
MDTISQALVLVFGLAIVAVIVSNGQAASFISTAGQFLVSMVQKIQQA